MLRIIGVSSLDDLIDQAIPADIRLTQPLDLPEAETEPQYLKRLHALSRRNRVFRSYIGMGYYGCITPAVIQRGMLENPGWYTPYTPYQAEIAQGRLESLLNFQTLISDLTGMEIANASLLDEATAAAEAMTMLYRARPRTRQGARAFVVEESCFPQTIAVMRGRAERLGIDVRVMPSDGMTFTADVFGALLQYPDGSGQIIDLRPIIAAARARAAPVAVAADLLALTLITPPGELGADVVVGSAQRFGVPMGFGGPHAAFFATREHFVRQMPGRIIGVSVDVRGQTAYRMALQTREQHIRREKATSNICTAQALLSNMAAMYAVHHGADGLRAIARRVHGSAQILSAALEAMGVHQTNPHFFDTLKIKLPSADLVDRVRSAALEAEMNFRYLEDGHVGISVDETTSVGDIADIVSVFGKAVGVAPPDVETQAGGADAPAVPPGLARTSAFLTHPVFSTYRTETGMMRYLRRLERKDIGLDTSMIPLGSCTMKLNAVSELLPLSWPEFAHIHPFAPADQVRGYRTILAELEAALCALTGLAAVSLQPNSGAQGELTGLQVIAAHHADHGETDRRAVLIPSSAHGTNPASAVLSGMEVVVVECDDQGNIDVEDLRAKAARHSDRLAALMVTYPSTHGVFEKRIREICEIVHERGGQVYLDGANMNAQVGLTSPAAIGADVCHLNLHKTFSIPHGGGGPGMGPIAVARHLAPYLPGHPTVPVGGRKGIPAVSAAPWGSASILLISYGYIRLLGARGLTEATKYAILNANYMKARLERHYDVLYAHKGRVAHEMIFDVRPFKAYGIDEQDVAKRLMDYGFHAPTVSFPVPGTFMVEPTESESKAEIDRFCDALIRIREEIQAVMNQEADPIDNVLTHAPHTAAEATSDDWTHPYTREQAVYPLPFVRANKFWPSVGRIDNPYGDRHLMCVCPPISAYGESAPEESAPRDPASRVVPVGQTGPADG